MSYQTKRLVEFHDTDAAGIMHFSVFFTFMEEAEHELLRNLDLSVMMETEDGRISWPRVSASCDYLEAVKFEDQVDIQVGIERIGEKSVTYTFEFQQVGRPVGRGQLTSVCCRIVEGKPPESIPIPAWFREKLIPLNIPPAEE